MLYEVITNCQALVNVFLGNAVALLAAAGHAIRHRVADRNLDQTVNMAPANPDGAAQRQRLDAVINCILQQRLQHQWR